MHSVAYENCNGREECKGTLSSSLLTIEVSSYSPAACCSHTPVLALVSASGGDEESVVLPPWAVAASNPRDECPSLLEEEPFICF